MIDDTLIRSLGPRPTYRPFARGRYDVSAGLSIFGKDFGNGPTDRRVFQFDETFASFHAAKQRSLQSEPSEFVCTTSVAGPLDQVISSFIVDRLLAESPKLFHRDGADLICRLTGNSLTPAMLTFNSLCEQLMEDVAVIQLDEHGKDSLVRLHICLPNRWSPREKIGRPFVEVHEPVAEIEPLNRRAPVLAKLMVDATSGLVRFAWGITFDEALNQHPTLVPPTGFHPANPRAIVRVERQTIFGFPDQRAALFTIRTYQTDVTLLNFIDRSALIAAIESMTPASLIYKGLSDARPHLLAWMRSLDSV